jgi:hypothetical protein
VTLTTQKKDLTARIRALTRSQYATHQIGDKTHIHIEILTPNAREKATFDGVKESQKIGVIRPINRAWTQHGDGEVRLIR